MWAVEPVWIREDVVLAIHARLIAEHGGLEGLRDSALLSSALARPRNLLAYSSQPPDVAALCAAYAFGLCQNHPFLDGNKRIALVVTRLFATMNGSELETSQAEKYHVDRLASGEWNEAEYAEWIRNRLRLKEKRSHSGGWIELDSQRATGGSARQVLLKSRQGRHRSAQRVSDWFGGPAKSTFRIRIKGQFSIANAEHLP